MRKPGMVNFISFGFITAFIVSGLFFTSTAIASSSPGPQGQSVLNPTNTAVDNKLSPSLPKMRFVEKREHSNRRIAKEPTKKKEPKSNSGASNSSRTRKPASSDSGKDDSTTSQTKPGSRESNQRNFVNQKRMESQKAPSVAPKKGITSTTQKRDRRATSPDSRSSRTRKPASPDSGKNDSITPRTKSRSREKNQRNLVRQKEIENRKASPASPNKKTTSTSRKQDSGIATERSQGNRDSDRRPGSENRSTGGNGAGTNANADNSGSADKQGDRNRDNSGLKQSAKNSQFEKDFGVSSDSIREAAKESGKTEAEIREGLATVIVNNAVLGGKERNSKSIQEYLKNPSAETLDKEALKTYADYLNIPAEKITEALSKDGKDVKFKDVFKAVGVMEVIGVEKDPNYDATSEKFWDKVSRVGIEQVQKEATGKKLGLPDNAAEISNLDAKDLADVYAFMEALGQNEHSENNTDSKDFWDKVAKKGVGQAQKDAIGERFGLPENAVNDPDLKPDDLMKMAKVKLKKEASEIAKVIEKKAGKKPGSSGSGTGAGASGTNETGTTGVGAGAGVGMGASIPGTGVGEGAGSGSENVNQGGGVNSSATKTGGATSGNVNATPETPAQQAPAQETPIQETPAQEAPAQEAPPQETPAQQAPPAQDAQAQTPAQEAPVSDTPASSESAGSPEPVKVYENHPGHEVYQVTDADGNVKYVTIHDGEIIEIVDAKSGEVGMDEADFTFEEVSGDGSSDGNGNSGGSSDGGGSGEGNSSSNSDDGNNDGDDDDDDDGDDDGDDDNEESTTEDSGSEDEEDKGSEEEEESTTPTPDGDNPHSTPGKLYEETGGRLGGEEVKNTERAIGAATGVGIGAPEPRDVYDPETDAGQVKVPTGGEVGAPDKDKLNFISAADLLAIDLRIQGGGVVDPPESSGGGAAPGVDGGPDLGGGPGPGPKNDNAIVIPGSLQGEDGDGDDDDDGGFFDGAPGGILNTIQGLSALQDKISSIQTTLNK